MSLLALPGITPETWYHLTDRARFKLDPSFAPADNAFAYEDRSGRPGIYLAPQPEAWTQGQGYWRPFLVELRVDSSVKRGPGVHGRYRGEMFVPASSFGKLAVARVVPLDVYVRETFGTHGWIEEATGRAFDTGAPITAKAWEYPFRGWRYTGPDVRSMPLTEINRLKAELRRAKL